VLAGALGLALPGGAASLALPRATGSVSFGTPTATPTFGRGVDFTQPVTTSGLRPRRVELLITFPGELGPEVKELTSVGDISSTTLAYSLKETDRHLYPNTEISARFRIVDGDGTAYEGPPLSLVYEDTRFDWKTVSGPLVRVHWYVGDDGFGRRALAIGESGVAKAEALLKVTETEPVDFYVYADQKAFYDALGPGTRENVGGEALSEIRTLFALITPADISQTWVGIVIPHELTHLVFNTAVKNPYHFPPRWLNEGLAVYLSQGYDASDRSQVDAAARSGSIIPLTGLAGQFPTTRDQFSLAYAESVSAVDFIVRAYGNTTALVQLILAYKAGVTDDEALKEALHLDSARFDKDWQASLGASPPVAYGPQPDPPGPVPSGWSSTPENAAPTPAGTGVAGTASAAPSSAGAPTTPSLPASGSVSTAATTGATAVAVAPDPPPTTTSLPVAESPVEPPPPTDQSALAAGLGVVAILLAGLGVFLALRRRPGAAP
jgi:hypothetical protein